MINGSEQLAERVTAVERKVDGLSTRVDVLATELHLLSDREEEHHQQTSLAFAEQRSYTDSLLAEMRSGFQRIDSQFQLIDSRFERVETSLGRLERKLDGFIDTQSRANEIAEQRLRRLEARG